MKKRIFIALTIVLTGVCTFLFNIFFNEAKNTAVTKLNEEQMIHAKQAALGIEDFFATWTRSLNSLSKMDEIIDTDAVGKRYMKFFYEANQEQIGSITRLDERGVILYNFPSSSSVETDISDQKHVRELLRDHKPVISDVFMAVEGFETVALHVPIFKGSAFKGSIGILINFGSLANRYLDVIKISKTGYAWVVSRDGTQLYSPIPGFTGKSVFETIKDSPSLIAMVNDMLDGHEGAAIYTFDRIGNQNVGQIRKYAVYMPVHLYNTFWSIAVASAEQDVLSGLISFRNKLAFVIGALFICGMVFSILGAKAWLIVKEEEKRKQTEKELQQSKDSLRIVEEQYRSIFENALEGIYQTSPWGQFLIVNPALAKMLGYDSPEDVVSSVRYSAHEVWANPNQRRDYIRLLEQNGVVLNYECEFYRKDKTRIWVSLNSSRVVGPDGEMLNYSGFIEDISERRWVQQALAKSRAQILAVFDSTNDLIWSVDPVNFGVVTWNSALADYFLKNWGIELRVGMPPEQLVPPEFVTTWREFYSRALREGSFTTEYCAASGTTILLISFNLLKHDGEVFGISIFGKDVTEPKKAEEALKRSEERYRALVETSSDWVWEVDANANYTYADPKIEKILGYAPEEIIGRTPFQLMPEDEAQRIRSTFAQIAAERRPFSGLINVNLHRNGRQVILETSGVPIFGPDGDFMGYRGMDRDVTEREHAGEILRESEAKFRSYIESAPFAIFVADREGRLMDFNLAATDLLGYDAATLKNMHIMDLHPEDDREEVLRAIAILQETGHVETEIRARKCDGQIVWVSLHVVMISDRLSLGYCQDISERKKADAALRQREKELMTLTGRLISTQEEELRRLSRELHDDLTQRLAVLAMDAGMIEQQLRPLKTQAAEETRDLKIKLIEVSEEVHDLSRQLHPSILDDLGLVQAVQSECAIFTKRTGIFVSLTPGDVPDAIPNDIALCLYRVIQEGLRNIANHAKINEARIVLQGLDGGVSLLIQDFGVGFEVREVQDKPCIGLSGMRERVRLAGGTMSLRSEPWKGTEIKISIPLGGKHGQTARTDRR